MAARTSAAFRSMQMHAYLHGCTASEMRGIVTSVKQSQQHVAARPSGVHLSACNLAILLSSKSRSKWAERKLWTVRSCVCGIVIVSVARL